MAGATEAPISLSDATCAFVTRRHTRIGGPPSLDRDLAMANRRLEVAEHHPVLRDTQTD